MPDPRPRVAPREWAAVLVVLAGALALRLWSLRAGLPGAGLLSPDEDTVVPLAMRMARDGTLDPDWFLYPTLYLTLLASALGVIGLVASGPGGLSFTSEAAYAWDPTPAILTGRVISLVAGLALVVLTWMLGRRAYGPGVGLVAAAAVAVAPVAVGFSRIAVTDMAMTALLAGGLVALVAAAETGRRRPLLVAAALVGLAASVKYNAALAGVVVLAVGVAWARRDGAGWGRAARAALAPAGLLVGGFVAGTPAAVLDPVSFTTDFWRQNRIVAEGWLGFEATGPGWLYNLHPVLSGALGAGLVILGAAGVALALVRRTRPDLVLAPFAIGYFAYVSTWNAHFDRYLLPIVPVLAVLAARAGLAGLAHARRRGRPAQAAAWGAGIALCLAVPLLQSAVVAHEHGRTDLRLEAARRIAAIVPPGALVVTDPLGAPLVDRAEGTRLAARGLPVRWFELIRLQTPRPGSRTDRRRDVGALRRGGLRWVVTSEGIAGRVRAAPGRYPVEVRFYRDLMRTARPVVSVPGSLGPGVTLWDLARRPVARGTLAAGTVRSRAGGDRG
ncbi:MAG: glycosyltransferase family 39 protein [Thermoleophilia bacterium]|nr:glycosyltransferase family 39 protein [Thermoleophilia bacterium]